MNKYISLFFSTVLFLTACKGNKASDGIIDRDHMISLLTDVHVTDGAMYNYNQTPDTLYKYGLGKYLELFKKHHTDSAQFKKSLQWYATQPTDLDKMYEQVADNLKKKLDSLNIVQQKNAKPDAVPAK
jgi:hypothetical protein